MNIKELIGETSDYDKKQSLEIKKPKSWCKSVSAFANTFGGTLIFGISDNDEIIGLDNPEKDAEILSEIIKNKITPIPEFKISFHQENNHVLMIIQIFKGEETPYYFSNEEGLTAYTRVGNESVKVSNIELKRLVLRGKNTTFDSQKSSYKAEDFAYSKLRERYKKWTGISYDMKNLVSFGLVTDDGYLTNAGALFADECPIRYSRIFCTRWNGLTKSNGILDSLDSAEYEGGLISLIENGENFIKRNTKMMWRKTSNSREEMPEYVERSYHEALVNAIAHRDYLVIGSEVHIDIFDDRMEIYSPGGMPDGSKIQDRDPTTVPSTRRNPVIADVFNRLGYMERQGSGFAKILDNYSFQVNYSEDKRPNFKSDFYQFTVIMPNLNYHVPENVTINVTKNVTINVTKNTTVEDDLSKKIINIIKSNPTITTTAIAFRLNITRRTVARKIKELKENGYIEHNGSRKKGYWKVNNSL